jgi:hypothetical protein
MITGRIRRSLRRDKIVAEILPLSLRQFSMDSEDLLQAFSSVPARR